MTFQIISTLRDPAKYESARTLLLAPEGFTGLPEHGDNRITLSGAMNEIDDEAFPNTGDTIEINLIKAGQ